MDWGTAAAERLDAVHRLPPAQQELGDAFECFDGRHVFDRTRVAARGPPVYCREPGGLTEWPKVLAC